MYKKAILLSPEYFEAYNNLGITYIKSKKYDEAFKAFKKALKIKPDNKVLKYNMKQLYRNYLKK